MTISNYLEEAYYNSEKAIYRLSLLDESTYFYLSEEEEEKKQKWYQKAWEAVKKFFIKIGTTIKRLVQWIAEKFVLIFKAIRNSLKKLFNIKEKDKPVQVDEKAVKETKTDNIIKQASASVNQQLKAANDLLNNIEKTDSSTVESCLESSKEKKEELTKTLTNEEATKLVTTKIGEAVNLLTKKIAVIEMHIKMLENDLKTANATVDRANKIIAKYSNNSNSTDLQNDDIDYNEIVTKLNNIAAIVKNNIQEINEMLSKEKEQLELANTNKNKLMKVSGMHINSEKDLDFVDKYTNIETNDVGNKSLNFSRDNRTVNKKLDKFESYNWIDFLL
jgi:hypothetical protein